MKATVTQYVSLTVMLLLIVAVVSILPESAPNLEESSFDKATTAANGISVVKSAQN